MSEEEVYKDEFEYADEIYPITTYWEKQQEEILQKIVNDGGSDLPPIDTLFTGHYRWMFDNVANKDTNLTLLFSIYQCALDFLVSRILQDELIDPIYKGEDVIYAYKKERTKLAVCRT